eukprot:TRINITY_DN920_c0_g1_i16.p2 TRINITY_DN920_c0_g1~~TRINITY_DN920_c0_g1_i16.p2  ORF type:complete len:172 (-),score=11.32 TRINITY_DN920_c0_g1_i16:8-523(-)
MINDDSKNLLNNEKTKRQIQIKQKLSQRNQDIGNFDHQNGLPPGNKLASNWIVLDLGVKPNANEYNLWEAGENWSIKFFGVQAGIGFQKESHRSYQYKEDLIDLFQQQITLMIVLISSAMSKESMIIRTPAAVYHSKISSVHQEQNTQQVSVKIVKKRYRRQQQNPYSPFF